MKDIGLSSTKDKLRAEIEAQTKEYLKKKKITKVKQGHLGKPKWDSRDYSI